MARAERQRPTTMSSKQQHQQQNENERGNILFMVLLAVVLIGLLTAAIKGVSNNEGSNIDNETLAIRASEVQRQAGGFEYGARIMLHNGISESALRFADPKANSAYGDLSADSDPSDQLFSPDGGAATYENPPSGVNDGSQWEFYGHTAMPGVGSQRADLIAVLPNVTDEFCSYINKIDGYTTTTQPTDSGTCLEDSSKRFNDSTQYDASPNTPDSATFTIPSATEGCVECGDSTKHFFHVLVAR